MKFIIDPSTQIQMGCDASSEAQDEKLMEIATSSEYICRRPVRPVMPVIVAEENLGPTAQFLDLKRAAD